MKQKNKHIGSDFDEFLNEEGMLEQIETVALKRVITYQLEKAMKIVHLTKTQMAEKMHTSRSELNRIFDPENESLTLNTLNRAASAVGKRLKVELV